MNILDRIFVVFGYPPDGQALVYFWVWAMVIITVGFAIYQLVQTYRLSNALTDRQLDEHRDLRPLMNAYHASFTELDGRQRTSESAEEYINDYSVLHASMQWNFLTSLPGIIVGLGILGTFVGLTAGISDISFDDTDAIQDSIRALLSGMGMAFVTSIWGMGLSIGLSVINRFSHQRIIRRVQNVVLDLDRSNRINQGDLSAIRFTERRRVLNELFDDYFVYQEEGRPQMPKNVLRELVRGSQLQTSSLSSLADDLGRTIEEILDTALANNNGRIEGLIEHQLMPVLNDLKNIKEDSSASVIEGIVGQLGESMQSMLTEFKSSVAGETKKELEELSGRLTEVSQSMLSIPSTMKATTEDVYETVEVMRGLITESVEETRRQQLTQREEMESGLRRTTKTYEDHMRQLQLGMTALIQQQQESITKAVGLMTNYEQLVSESKEAHVQLQRVVTTSLTVARQLDDVAGKLTDNSKALSVTSELLEGSSGNISSYLTEFTGKNQTLVDSQLNGIERNREVLAEHAERFAIIESGLKSIFADLKEGLESYQEVTAENLNTYLMKFSEAYTNALSETNRTFQALDESIADLTDAVGKESRPV